MRWLMQPLLRLRQRAAGLVLELTGKPVAVDTGCPEGPAPLSGRSMGGQPSGRTHQSSLL